MSKYETYILRFLSMWLDTPYLAEIYEPWENLSINRVDFSLFLADYKARNEK